MLFNPTNNNKKKFNNNNQKAIKSNKKIAKL